jgi:hypothetical protein
MVVTLLLKRNIPSNVDVSTTDAQALALVNEMM